MNVYSCLIVALAATLTISGESFCDEASPSGVSSDAGAEQFDRLKQQWKLRLVPEECRKSQLVIDGTQWAQRGLKDILGRGSDRLIEFSVPDDDTEGRSISLTSVRYHSVNSSEREKRETAKHKLITGGPFLEYDGLLHTAFIEKDAFVPDAVIKVGDNSWYTAVATRANAAESGDGGVVLTEYRFDFEENPAQNSQGKLTLHRHIRKTSAPEGVLSDSETRFVRVREARDKRLPHEVQIGTPERRSLTAWFYSDPDFAVLRDSFTREAGVFQKEKQTAK